MPVGYWKYGKDLKTVAPPNKKEQPKNEMPELEKFCAVFYTLGERRLGSHLLNGFEKMLSAISKTAISKYELNEDSMKRIMGIFPKDREEKNLATFNNLRNFEMPGKVGDAMPIKEWCKNPIYLPEDYEKLISFTKLHTKESQEILDKINKACSDVESWADILLADLKEEKKKLFIDIMKEMINNLPKSGKSVLEHLFDLHVRIGYETGLVKRAMQDNDINWGTFIDHSPLELHCNAHCNNFAVLPPVFFYNLPY